jgi:5'(3')-deoxyribonucleotidase
MKEWTCIEYTDPETQKVCTIYKNPKFFREYNKLNKQHQKAMLTATFFKYYPDARVTDAGSFKVYLVKK